MAEVYRLYIFRAKSFDMHPQTAVLLHGALGSSAQFSAFATALGTGFQPVTFNFAGHGGAILPPEPLRIEDMAEQLSRFLHHAGLGPGPVFGYSMGGYVALYLERHQPGTFTHIYTLGTKLDWQPEAAAREAALLDAETLAAKVPKFAASLAERHAPVDWKEILTATAEMIRHLGQNPALGTEDFPKITCPVRLCVGDRDTTVTIEETLAAYRHLPAGQFAVLPATPHPWEKADAVRVALDFAGFVRA